MYKALIVLALACVALASESYEKAPPKAAAGGYASTRKDDGYGYNYAHAANKAREAKVRANLLLFLLKIGWNQACLISFELELMGILF